jgi:hypothetical protein
VEVAMSEYDYGGYEGLNKEKTFVSETEKELWEAFSEGAIDESERTIATGHPFVIQSKLHERWEKEKANERELS